MNLSEKSYESPIIGAMAYCEVADARVVGTMMEIKAEPDEDYKDRSWVLYRVAVDYDLSPSPKDIIDVHKGDHEDLWVNAFEVKRVCIPQQ